MTAQLHSAYSPTQPHSISERYTTPAAPIVTIAEDDLQRRAKTMQQLSRSVYRCVTVPALPPVAHQMRVAGVHAGRHRNRSRSPPD